MFILYGVFKLVGFQFGLSEAMGNLRLREAHPQILTWYFFDSSPLYKYCIGITQIVTGLLLIIPRTAAIGALCFLVIISNIVLINFGYNIALDVKILSSILLALDGVLLWHYLPRYKLLLQPAENKKFKFDEVEE